MQINFLIKISYKIVAILIFFAQLPELINVPNLTYGMVIFGLLIIYLLPKVIRIVPSPLVCILALTFVAQGFELDLRTVGDIGALPDSLPTLLLPDVPLAGWDIAYTEKYGLVVVEVNISCNFFCGKFNKNKYFKDIYDTLTQE